MKPLLPLRVAVVFWLPVWLFFCLASSVEAETLVYFGTYTGKKSKGIYVSRLDPATGRLTPATVAAETASPSFLAVHPSGRFLYAVNEVSRYDGKPAGSVIGYTIDRATGTLKALNNHSTQGAGPCHLIVDPTGKNVLVANYGGGSVAVMPVQPDGTLKEPSSFIQHKGSSANASRQEGPHAHGIYVDPANRFAFVPDLGLDKVMIYRFEPGTGKLSANQPDCAAIASGSGPRHFAFLPNGRFAYVINEMLCTVTAFSYDASRGELKEIETVSSLPLGQRVSPGYSTAELFAHPSGRFLYGSNRGHDTIAVFGVDLGTGKLSLIQHASTQGRVPRSFGIDPTGKWLLAANQDSDTVVVFQIDSKDGSLRPTGQVLEVGAPVSVTFVQ
jgi:6-phosphogluconolactonase